MGRREGEEGRLSDEQPRVANKALSEEGKKAPSLCITEGGGDKEG